MAINDELNELFKQAIGEAAGARLAAALDAFFLAKTGGTMTAALTMNAALTMGDGINIVADTTTGTKIGTATAQKLGFWNVTPVIQQASAAQAAVTPSTDLTGGDTVSAAGVLAAVQAVETLVNRLRADLVTVGIIKGAA